MCTNQYSESVHAGLVPRSSTEPDLACSCRTCDEHGYSLAQIVACGEVEHLLLVHSTLAVVDDLAYRDQVAEAGFLCQTLILACRAVVQLGLYKQLQAIFQGERVMLTRLLYGSPECAIPGIFRLLRAFDIFL